MRMTSLCTSVLLAAAAVAPDAARSEEIYFRGLGEIFSAGICTVGPGSCRSFLSVEAEIERLCADRPAAPVKVAGHSLGASAAMRAVHGLAECGVKVSAAAFLDPMTHPYDMPAGTRVFVIYSVPYAGVGEGHPGVMFYPGGHVALANDPTIISRVRGFLRGAK